VWAVRCDLSEAVFSVGTTRVCAERERVRRAHLTQRLAEASDAVVHVRGALTVREAEEESPARSRHRGSQVHAMPPAGERGKLGSNTTDAPLLQYSEAISDRRDGEALFRTRTRCAAFW
jgi:hypothetical protein